MENLAKKGSRRVSSFASILSRDTQENSLSSSKAEHPLQACSISGEHQHSNPTGLPLWALPHINSGCQICVYQSSNSPSISYQLQWGCRITAEPQVWPITLFKTWHSWCSNVQAVWPTLWEDLPLCCLSALPSDKGKPKPRVTSLRDWKVQEETTGKESCRCHRPQHKG